MENQKRVTTNPAQEIIDKEDDTKKTLHKSRVDLFVNFTVEKLAHQHAFALAKALIKEERTSQILIVDQDHQYADYKPLTSKAFAEAVIKTLRLVLEEAWNLHSKSVGAIEETGVAEEAVMAPVEPSLLTESQPSDKKPVEPTGVAGMVRRTFQRT